ncbi:MAG: acylphosphatase [Solirubrobacterales bacterium]
MRFPRSLVGNPPTVIVIARHVIVSGNVQGVFFRDTTQSRAREHGVQGWVRNREDGTVEAVFEGSVAAVTEMLEFCEHGPERADVNGVEVTEREPEGHVGFEVRR